MIPVVSNGLEKYQSDLIYHVSEMIDVTQQRFMTSFQDQFAAECDTNVFSTNQDEGGPSPVVVRASPQGAES